MSNVIEFNQLSRLRKELAEKTSEAEDLKVKANSVNAVNEMLKLQLLDLLDQLTAMTDQIELLKNNVISLQGRLPN
jgi:chromosome segregation ATPase